MDGFTQMANRSLNLSMLARSLESNRDLLFAGFYTECRQCPGHISGLPSTAK